MSVCPYFCFYGKILGGGMAAEVAHRSCTDLPPTKK